MKKYFWILLCSFVLLASNIIYADSFPIIDAHLHLVSFVQETQGAKLLIKQMDKAGITKAVIFGMPVTKEWENHQSKRPIYALDDNAKIYYYSFTDALVYFEIKNLPLTQQARFYPLISGFDPADKNAVDHIKRLVNYTPNFWHGIGEILLRHGKLSKLLYSEIPNPQMKSINQVNALAAKCHVPILIHSDISLANNEKAIYLKELETMLRKNPNTIFVWPHVGVDYGVAIKNHVAITDQLLQKNKNLNIDLSWIVYQEEILDLQGNPKKEWIALIEKYPDRFLIGTDLIGDFSNYTQSIRKYDVLLNQLDPTTARWVAHQNAERIYKNTMKSDCWK